VFPAQQCQQDTTALSSSAGTEFLLSRDPISKTAEPPYLGNAVCLRDKGPFSSLKWFLEIVLPPFAAYRLTPPGNDTSLAPASRYALAPVAQVSSLTLTSDTSSDAERSQTSPCSLAVRTVHRWQIYLPAERIGPMVSAKRSPVPSLCSNTIRLLTQATGNHLLSSSQLSRAPREGPGGGRPLSSEVARKENDLTHRRRSGQLPKHRDRSVRILCATKHAHKYFRRRLEHSRFSVTLTPQEIAARCAKQSEWMALDCREHTISQQRSEKSVRL